jgi:hypothetical protein
VVGVRGWGYQGMQRGCHSKVGSRANRGVNTAGVVVAIGAGWNLPASRTAALYTPSLATPLTMSSARMPPRPKRCRDHNQVTPATW